MVGHPVIVAAAAGAEGMEYARWLHTQTMIFENAGLFWILAEAGILYLVLAGRRYIETSPLPDSLALTARERRRAFVWGSAFVAGCVATYWAGLTAPPLHASMPASLSQLQDAYAQYAHTHLGIWAVFVTIWVVLEVLIVFHGSRGYWRLRELLGEGPSPTPGSEIRPFVLLFGLALLAPFAGWAATDRVVEALKEAQAADAMYRNAVYLYLRLAGIVWIVVEWNATVIAWRSYRLVAAAAARSGRR